VVAGLSVVAMGVAYAMERTGWLDMSRLLPSGVVDLLMLMIIFAASAGVLNSAIRRMVEASAHARRQSEVLQATNVELAESRDALAEQKARLQRRTAHLDASIEVARAALASVGDVRQLLFRVVEVISEQFGYYHAGIFWIDPSGEWVSLQAASSRGGRRMLAQEHRLPMGQGIVGYVAQTGEARIALDVGDDAVFFDNPNLPETRSEMAAPLELQGRVIGVLDVQSTAPAAFTEDDISVLRSVADQISLALANARLLEDAQQRVSMMQRAYGEMNEEAWQELLRSVPDLGFVSGVGGTLPLAEESSAPAPPVREEITEIEPGTMAVPVKAGGQVLGYVEVHLPADRGTWTPERMEMLETLSGQLSQALERARLYRETQRAAAQQRAIAEVGTRIRESLDMEAMLRTAAREMRSALGLQDLVVRLASPEKSVRQSRG
jgi:GAF domain-containing protein